MKRKMEQGELFTPLYLDSIVRLCICSRYDIVVVLVYIMIFSIRMPLVISLSCCYFAN